MTPFARLVSALVPLPAANVDTDQIIPAQFVNVQGQPALAAALFANLKAADPGFVLNRPELRGRQVLLVGHNFGCGSSREAAAWALAAGGFRALLGRSFNTTFTTNCLNNGLLPVTTPEPAHRALLAACAADPGLEVHIDLEARRVEAPAAAVAFDIVIEPFARDLLLHGLDELDYLLDRLPAIRAFQPSPPSP